MGAPLRIIETVDSVTMIADLRPSVRISAAASALDADESTVRKLVRRGDLEGHRLGRRGIRIYVDSIRAYQERRPTGSPRQRRAPAPRRQTTDAATVEAVAHLRALGCL